jgi:hypothetical protein
MSVFKPSVFKEPDVSIDSVVPRTATIKGLLCHKATYSAVVCLKPNRTVHLYLTFQLSMS